MSGTLRLRGATSGYSELQAPAVAADQTFVLPTAGGTLLTTDSPVPQLTLELGSASEPSLRFEGDTDTGLFSQGTNTLNLVTGGSSKVVLGASAHTIYAGTGATVRAVDIDSSGNVGVGVTSNLAGSGDLSLQGNKAVRWAHATDGTQYADIYGDTSSNLVFRNGSSSTEQMRIDSLGRVGIGCTPASGLQLKRATPELSLQPTADTQTGYITFINSASSTRGAVEYSYASDYMAFKSAGSERMRVASNGRVGIGETSPDALLHLNFTSGNPQLILERSSSSTAQYGLHAFSNTFTIKDEAQNEERLRIDSAGKVGIGTTSPNRNLTVFDSSNAGVEIQSGTSGQSSVFFTDTADTNIGMIGYYHNVDAMFFRVNDDERMRIDSSGRLLVGTSTATNYSGSGSYTPTFQFKGSSTAESSSLILASSDGPAYFVTANSGGGSIVSNGESLGFINFKGYDGNSYPDFAQIKAVVDNTPGDQDCPGRLVFSTTADGESSPTERMRIDYTGGLYIGPSSNYGTSNYAQTTGNGNFYYRRDDGSSAGSLIVTNNADRGWSAAYLNKFAWTSGDDARWITFYINGSSQDSITWTGSAISYGTSSDYRRKTNATTYTGGLEKVKQLHVREYDWIEFPDADRSVGFFAHELQEIYPQAVTGVKDGMKTDEFTGEQVPDYQGIDYGKITPLLASALQEAIAKIETLEANNLSLENRIAALENS